jgi:hypothetical protein
VYFGREGGTKARVLAASKENLGDRTTQPHTRPGRVTGRPAHYTRKALGSMGLLRPNFCWPV